MKVRFSPEHLSELIEYEVELNSIPVNITAGRGRNVMVEWRMLDEFDNAGKFFTDSNEGLMLEREFNHRRDFTFDDPTSNISANFYPVDSAIAIRSKDVQVTIMNDRAQAGSGAIGNGTIQLMQHRRLMEDDNKGVLEPLDEVDEHDNGL